MIDNVVTNEISIFGPVLWFGVKKQSGGEYILITQPVEPLDIMEIAAKPFGQLNEEEMFFWRTYFDGVGRIQLPYWPVSFDGKMNRCFPDETVWSGPNEIVYQGAKTVEFQFESPEGRYFNSPTRGRIVLDRERNYRWLLMEYDQRRDGEVVGKHRFQFEYPNDDSGDFEVNREFFYVDGAQEVAGQRETTTVKFLNSMPDSKEFYPEYYGIQFVSGGSTGRRPWIWFAVGGAALLLIAAAAYLRQRSTV